MTNQSEPGPSAGDNHNPPDGTRPLAGEPPRSRSQSRSARPRLKAGRLWIGLAVIVVLGLAAGLITYAVGGTKPAASGGATGLSSTGGTTGTTGTAAGSTGGTAPRGGTSTAKGKVISANKLAQQGGALTLPTAKESSVTSWQSGAGGHDLTAVSNWLGNALQAGGLKQYSSMKTGCTRLASSVTAAQAGPQIPDPAMQKVYATALTELAKGAADCRTAISVSPNGEETVQAHVDTATLQQATTELSAGAKDIFRATAEIQILARQHH